MYILPVAVALMSLVQYIFVLDSSYLNVICYDRWLLARLPLNFLLVFIIQLSHHALIPNHFL